ncbi:hypothetical protein [Mucilaginibacter pedocola]|uniref:Outer membrane protein beta-barrel domain-containing protein n=1 Tax=Mucilaginibacter pedocola TaxID=1792845 RepID=A0A1S9PI42_9SPHI|nr:hypothetical protein [Mucilaginibacter pedocola]OOQ60619.1 hypothetical protein BC343_23770 [Mucilaginibacter pedocola]
MKVVFKTLTLSLAFAGISLAANAQTSTITKSAIRYSIGVETGIPIAAFGDYRKLTLGGSIQADIPVANQLFITLNAGFNNHIGESVKGLVGGPDLAFKVPDLKLIPVKAGLKFFPTSNFYVQAEGGASFLLNKADFYNNHSVAFVYTQQFGVQFPLSASGNFVDVGIRHETTTKYSRNEDASEINFVGLRLAYGF